MLRERKKERKEVRASKWESIKSRVQGELIKEKEIMLGDSKEYENKYRNCYILGEKVSSYYHKSGCEGRNSQAMVFTKISRPLCLNV